MSRKKPKKQTRQRRENTEEHIQMDNVNTEPLIANTLNNTEDNQFSINQITRSIYSMQDSTSREWSHELGQPILLKNKKASWIAILWWLIGGIMLTAGSVYVYSHYFNNRRDMKNNRTNTLIKKPLILVNSKNTSSIIPDGKINNNKFELRPDEIKKFVTMAESWIFGDWGSNSTTPTEYKGTPPSELPAISDLGMFANYFIGRLKLQQKYSEEMQWFLIKTCEKIYQEEVVARQLPMNEAGMLIAMDILLAEWFPKGRPYNIKDTQKFLEHMTELRGLIQMELVRVKHVPEVDVYLKNQGFTKNQDGIKKQKTENETQTKDEYESRRFKREGLEDNAFSTGVVSASVYIFNEIKKIFKRLNIPLNYLHRKVNGYFWGVGVHDVDNINHSSEGAYQQYGLTEVYTRQHLKYDKPKIRFFKRFDYSNFGNETQAEALKELMESNKLWADYKKINNDINRITDSPEMQAALGRAIRLRIFMSNKFEPQEVFSEGFWDNIRLVTYVNYLNQKFLIANAFVYKYRLYSLAGEGDSSLDMYMINAPIFPAEMPINFTDMPLGGSMTVGSDPVGYLITSNNAVKIIENGIPKISLSGHRKEGLGRESRTKCEKDKKGIETCYDIKSRGHIELFHSSREEKLKILLAKQVEVFHSDMDFLVRDDSEVFYDNISKYIERAIMLVGIVASPVLGPVASLLALAPLAFIPILINYLNSDEEVDVVKNLIIPMVLSLLLDAAGECAPVVLTAVLTKAKAIKKAILQYGEKNGTRMAGKLLQSELENLADEIRFIREHIADKNMQEKAINNAIDVFKSKMEQLTYGSRKPQELHFNKCTRNRYARTIGNDECFIPPGVKKKEDVTLDAGSRQPINEEDVFSGGFTMRNIEKEFEMEFGKTANINGNAFEVEFTSGSKVSQVASKNFDPSTHHSDFYTVTSKEDPIAVTELAGVNKGRVYLANEHPDFYLKNLNHNMQKIRYTLIHEFVHSWLYRNGGGFSQSVMKNIFPDGVELYMNIDEAFTEYFAKKIANKLGISDELIETGYFTEIKGYMKDVNSLGGERIWLGGFPEFIKDYLFHMTGSNARWDSLVDIFFRGSRKKIGELHEFAELFNDYPDIIKTWREYSTTVSVKRDARGKIIKTPDNKIIKYTKHIIFKDATATEPKKVLVIAERPAPGVAKRSVIAEDSIINDKDERVNDKDDAIRKDYDVYDEFLGRVITAMTEIPEIIGDGNIGGSLSVNYNFSKTGLKEDDFILEWETKKPNGAWLKNLDENKLSNNGRSYTPDNDHIGSMVRCRIIPNKKDNTIIGDGLVSESVEISGVLPNIKGDVFLIPHVVDGVTKKVELAYEFENNGWGKDGSIIIWELKDHDDKWVSDKSINAHRRFYLPDIFDGRRDILRARIIPKGRDSEVLGKELVSKSVVLPGKLSYPNVFVENRVRMTRKKLSTELHNNNNNVAIHLKNGSWTPVIFLPSPFGTISVGFISIFNESRRKTIVYGKNKNERTEIKSGDIVTFSLEDGGWRVSTHRSTDCEQCALVPPEIKGKVLINVQPANVAAIKYDFESNGSGKDDSEVVWEWLDKQDQWQPFKNRNKFSNKNRYYTPGIDDIGDSVRARVIPKGADSKVTGPQAFSDVIKIRGGMRVSGRYAWIEGNV